jgi:Methyltransferase domain
VLRRHSGHPIVDLLPRRSVGCEVGVWKGELSAALLRYLRPKRLHLVDPWLFMPDKPKAIYGGREATSQADMDAIYEQVLARFEDELRRGRVVIHRETSVGAAPAVADGSLDWVYVDGDHTYDGVRADLEAWAPKLKPSGLLTGDDYGSFGWWEGGVQRAVDEFVAARSPEVLLLTSHFALRL